MKVLTVLGTRPEIIRLSIMIERFDERFDHVLVDTGQNQHRSLSALFYEELLVRPPDHRLEVGPGPLGGRIGAIMAGVDEALERERPDRVVVLGDTDSALGAFVAKRRGVPVIHLEAGNRCFDDRVPEEVNRRVIDHFSDVLLPYTPGSRDNLLAEGIESHRVVVSGNPINEVMGRHWDAIVASDVVERLGLTAGGYALATAHRQENVDDAQRLGMLARSLERVARMLDVPLVLSVHPRTADRLVASGVALGGQIVALEPFGFVDFVALERSARLVCTDSGTVQEECCILDVPTVTMRETTERPETVACGSNVVSGLAPDDVADAVARQDGRHGWTAPEGYLDDEVSRLVTDVVASSPDPT